MSVTAGRQEAALLRSVLSGLVALGLVQLREEAHGAPGCPCRRPSRCQNHAEGVACTFCPRVWAPVAKCTVTVGLGREHDKDPLLRPPSAVWASCFHPPARWSILSSLLFMV